ncbi:Aldo/keto reductase/potassium channel subunit beta [Trema orientale]|uniref:Aldo/keto reductase/potassium channel subunit beta n=1 Tax=Trema orientale TaxID=63057 RepID=A0A2P5FQ68_TREOI|nr:Aldo/keto reductase/potassium channel subunit beta [Trema orientale]
MEDLASMGLVRGIEIMHGIYVTAHTPLGGAADNTEMFGSVSCLNDPVLKKYNRSMAQIVLQWGIQQNTVVIPKKSKPERLKENFQVFDFELYQKGHGFDQNSG